MTAGLVVGAALALLVPYLGMLVALWSSGSKNAAASGLAFAGAVLVAWQQRAALRGIEHFLRVEQGLAVPTPELAELEAWVEAEPDLERRQTLRAELRDPNKNFMRDPRASTGSGDGELVRKYFEYEPVGDGTFADRSNPADVVVAPRCCRRREDCHTRTPRTMASRRVRQKRIRFYERVAVGIVVPRVQRRAKILGQRSGSGEDVVVGLFVGLIVRAVLDGNQ